MRSFISNSDLAGLLKSVVVAAGLIGLAWIFVPAHVPYDEYPVFGAETLNGLILEQYLHEYDQKPIVLLGSSIQTGIPPFNCRPDNVATLYLQGRSAMTGLEAIRLIGAHPKVLFIEVSTLTIGTDFELTNTVFVPLYWQLRSLVPPLRHDRNWVVLMYRSKVYERSPPRFNLEEPTASIVEWKESMAPRTPPLDDRPIDDATEADLKARIANNIIADLKVRIHALQQQGTRVIFQDPVDPALRIRPPLRELRAALRSAFPDVEFIDAPDDLFPIYRWDRMHFQDASGLHYFNYLMKRAGLQNHPKCTLVVNPTNAASVEARSAR